MVALPAAMAAFEAPLFAMPGRVVDWLGDLQPAQLRQQRGTAFAWPAVLIARIYEVFPLLCPMCGGQMRLIAFICETAPDIETAQEV